MMFDEESFNADFCVILDCYLSTALSISTDKICRGWVTDGVMMPFINQQLTKRNVSIARQINTTVWMLNGRKSLEFELVIYFGKHALRRYAKNHKLNDCLPPLEADKSVFISLEERRMGIHLK